MRLERLILYWTREIQREDAIMVFHYGTEMLERVGRSIDSTVANITAKKFHIAGPPEKDNVCRGCDIRHTCISEGIVKSLSKIMDT